MQPKKPSKGDRELKVLMGLVALYLETGAPVGSNTLRQNGFESISSATIRNYFANLEKNGYLKQQHSSGGRIPTEAAFKLYVDKLLEQPITDLSSSDLQDSLGKSSREVATYLQRAAELLSEKTNCAVFLSSPRFDQDLLLDINLMQIDQNRCLCVLVTDFGMVHTELFYVERGFKGVNLEKVAHYLRWRISHHEKPDLSSEEEKLATYLYKEIMLRHIVTYSNFSAEDLHKAGFSKLLNYPDFANTASLASGLSLFENEKDMRGLLQKACENKKLCCFLGDDLAQLETPLSGCSVIVVPYRIHQTLAGAIAILGPNRLPYEHLFSTLKSAAETISETLTSSLYKFKINFRKPKVHQIELENQSLGLLIEKRDNL